MFSKSFIQFLKINLSLIIAMSLATALTTATGTNRNHTANQNSNHHIVQSARVATDGINSQMLQIGKSLDSDNIVITIDADKADISSFLKDLNNFFLKRK